MTDGALAARPWHRAYWLGDVDPRPLAAMRIAGGAYNPFIYFRF